jgi:hypothetical protein
MEVWTVVAAGSEDGVGAGSSDEAVWTGGSKRAGSCG